MLKRELLKQGFIKDYLTKINQSILRYYYIVILDGYKKVMY